MSLVIKSIADFKNWRKTINSSSVGFVPTMGALHDGHGSLLKKSKNENSYTVLSIFVNPTQFNDPKDFEKYPNTFDSDLKMAEQLGVDVVFAPTKDEFYPDHYKYRITETEFSKELCGAHRPGHFDGVLTIVMKLFQVVHPTNAYFGEKDYQQLQLIKGMVDAYFINLKIVAVPTMRESDGLAMSSRNIRLNPKERSQAPLLYKTLVHSKTAEEATAKLAESGFRVDYVVDKYHRRFAAAFLGEVRLIDNISLDDIV